MAIEIAPIRAPQVEACLTLAAEIFARDSSLHRAAGIEDAAYLACLRPGFLHNVEQGLSLAAWEGAELLGGVITCDLLDQGALLPDARLRPMQALMHEMEHAYLAAHPAQKGEAALIDMAFLRPEARGRGLYAQLRVAAQVRAAEAGYRRIVGLLSAPATQQLVVGRLGHRVMARQTLATYEFEGQLPFATITAPEALWLTEGDLP